MVTKYPQDSQLLHQASPNLEPQENLVRLPTQGQKMPYLRFAPSKRMSVCYFLLWYYRTPEVSKQDDVIPGT